MVAIVLVVISDDGDNNTSILAFCDLPSWLRAPASLSATKSADVRHRYQANGCCAYLTNTSEILYRDFCRPWKVDDHGHKYSNLPYYVMHQNIGLFGLYNDAEVVKKKTLGTNTREWIATETLGVCDELDAEYSVWKTNSSRDRVYGKAYCDAAVKSATDSYTTVTHS